MSLRSQDQQTDQGGDHRDQQQAGNSFRADPKGARRDELDVAETQAVITPQPAISCTKQGRGGKDQRSLKSTPPEVRRAPQLGL